jgi:hypothetical protein
MESFMQKKRLLKFVLIGLSILLVTSVIYVYAFSPSEDEAFLCTKSVTLEGGEEIILEFYMPSPASAVRFDFNISSGTIKYRAEPSSHFDGNQSYFEQFMGEATSLEVENGPTGFGWSIAVGENPEKLNEEHLDQIWYLYLLNEDSYDKEVQVDITKIWEP